MTATLQQPGQQQYLAEQEASCHAQILPDSSPVPSSLTQNQQEVPAAEQFLSSQEPPVPQASRLVQQEQNVSQQEVTHPDGKSHTTVPHLGMSRQVPLIAIE